jgi:hypothetical protein
MTPIRFSDFLQEAFPPAKKSGSSTGPSKPQVAKPSVPAVKTGEAPVDANANVPEQAVDDANGAGALAAMQLQQQQQQMDMQAAAQKKSLAKDEKERKHVKKLRAQADAEVAAGLEDKYNDQEDEVIFWPELLTFAQHAASKNPTETTTDKGPTSDTKTEDSKPGKKSSPAKKKS